MHDVDPVAAKAEGAIDPVAARAEGAKDLSIGFGVIGFMIIAALITTLLA